MTRNMYKLDRRVDTGSADLNRSHAQDSARTHTHHTTASPEGERQYHNCLSHPDLEPRSARPPRHLHSRSVHSINTRQTIACFCCTTSFSSFVRVCFPSSPYSQPGRKSDTAAPTISDKQQPWLRWDHSDPVRDYDTQ